MKKSSKSQPVIKQTLLKKKIDEYLTPEIGRVIVDATDLIMRLRLGQLTRVVDILNRHCSLHEEGKGPDIDGPLYKALELGEYLQCLKDNPNCPDADKCWITRKGLAPCRQRVKDAEDAE